MHQFPGNRFLIEDDTSVIQRWTQGMRNKCFGLWSTVIVQGTDNNADRVATVDISST